MIDAVMCGEMTAKEYLSQAYRIDQRINAKLEQVMALRALATKATGTLSDMPRSDSSNVWNACHRWITIILSPVRWMLTYHFVSIF